jgi:hypothetical protein
MAQGAGVECGSVRLGIMNSNPVLGRWKIREMLRFLFDVPAKLETHGGENFARKVIFAA